MFKSWPVTLSGRILIIQALLLWVGAIVALAFTVVLVYSKYGLLSKLLLLRVCREKRHALMEIHFLLIWQGAALHLQEGISIVTCCQTVAICYPTAGIQIHWDVMPRRGTLCALSTAV